MHADRARLGRFTAAVLTASAAGLAVLLFVLPAGATTLSVSPWLGVPTIFLLAATAFSLLQRERLAFWLAVPAVLAGLVSVAAYLLAYNGVNETLAVLGLRLLAVTDLHLAAGLSLLASGLATMGAVARRLREFSVEGLAASCLLVVVLVPAVLLGQRYRIVPLEAGLLVHPLLPMEAVLLLGIAALLFLQLLHARRNGFEFRHRFLPLTAFALLLALSFHLWLVLAGQDQHNMRRQSQATAERLQASLTEHLADRVDAIHRMALRVAAAGNALDRETWQRDAEAYLRDFESVSAIGVISADRMVRWTVARNELNYQEGERYAVDEMRRKMLARTLETGDPAFSEPLPLSSGGWGQLVAIPMHEGGEFAGWLVAGLRYSELFTQRIAHVAPDFAVRVDSEGIAIYSRGSEDAHHPLAWITSRQVRVGNLAWQIHIWPERTFFSKYLLWLPGFLLMMGVTAAILFGVTLYQLEAQRRYSADLRDSEERYRLVVEQTGEVVYDYDIASGQIRWAGATEELLGMTMEQMNAAIDVEGWARRVHPDDAPAALEQLEYAQRHLHRYVCEYRFQRGDGSYVFMEDHGAFLAGPKGGAVRMLGTLSDITERREFNEQMKHLAHYDQQTGLRNRVWFMEEAVSATERALEERSEVWFVFMDVDRFKVVNETLGHVIGDLLLEAVARRLEGLVGERGALARLGGDEFGVSLQASGMDRATAAAFCEILMREFALPFNVAGHSLFVTLSVGVACFPENGASAQAVIRAAETAMFRAKQRGQNTYAFYEASMSAGARENLEIANALRRALENDEFHLVFQPRVSLAGGHITGMEALLRWDNPERGSVSPAIFIPIAEETGLIGPIGWYVVDAAAVAARQLGGERMRDRRLAINVSARQLADANFVPELVRRVQAAGAVPHWFEIELTESLIMADPQQSRELLTLLHDAGFSISIDDFGTGYSSLSYLKHFPADNLKIDRSFVMGLPDNEDDAAIVRTIIRMGQGLGLRLIAEGIETEGQSRFLREAGCQDAQGFLFARPMEFDGLVALLDKGRG